MFSKSGLVIHSPILFQILLPWRSSLSVVLGAVQSVLGSPWLCPVWWAALGLPCRVRALSRGAWGLLCRCGVQASHCRGFSRCGARPRGACTSEVATRWLSSCGTHGMWDLPRSGIEPVSAALQGGFLTTGSPGKSSRSLLIVYFIYSSASIP